MQPTTPEDESDMAAFPYDEEKVRASIGATAAHGEEGYSTLARLYVPLCLSPVAAMHGTCALLSVMSILCLCRHIK